MFFEKSMISFSQNLEYLYKSDFIDFFFEYLFFFFFFTFPWKVLPQTSWLLLFIIHIQLWSQITSTLVGIYFSMTSVAHLVKNIICFLDHCDNSLTGLPLPYMFIWINTFSTIFMLLLWFFSSFIILVKIIQINTCCLGGFKQHWMWGNITTNTITNGLLFLF